MASWPLLVYIGLVPACIAPIFRYSGHDASRILQLGVLVLGSLALTVARPSARVQRATMVTIVATALLAGASVAASEVPLMALRELALLAGLVALSCANVPAIAADSGQSVRMAVLAGCGIQSFLLIFLGVAAVLTHRPLVWSELTGGYDNYRFFNHVQTIAMPLLAGIALHEARGKIGWWTASVSLVIYAAYVCCSGARGTALAILAAMGLALIVFGRSKSWPVVSVLLRAFAAGAVLYVLAFIALPAWTGYRLGAAAERSVASLASDSSRLELWRSALDQIHSAPWLGIGPMHYAHVPNPKAAHPHNIYLQVAAEWGLPLLLVLLVTAWRCLARLGRAVRSADSQTGPEGVALWMACVAILLDGAVSGNFVMPVPQMWIALCFAWAAAWTRRQPAPAALTSSMPSPSPFSRMLAVSALVLQLWLIAAAWPEAVDLKSHLEHVRRDLVQNAKTNPRFWSDGWF